MLKILDVQRVELVVHDPDAEARKLAELLPFHFERSKTEAHGVLSQTDWDIGLELAGPLNENSALKPRLDTSGEGLLTIVFRVDSIEAVISWAKENDIDVLVDLADSHTEGRFKHYRQVSLANHAFPAQVSFTFCEYEEA